MTVETSADAQRPLVDLIASVFVDESPGEAADVLDGMAAEQTAQLLQELTKTQLAAVVREMNQDAAARVLEYMTDPSIQSLLTTLDEVRAAGLLSRVSASERERLLSLLPPGEARAVREVLDFPAATAGWFMDPRVTLFSEHATCDHAMSKVRSISGRRVTDLIVADLDGHFVGVVALQDVVAAPVGTSLSELVNRQAVSIQPMAGLDQVRAALDQHKLASLPVVGLDGRVLGIIRHDALVTAAEQSIGGNLQQMVGAAAEERALSSPWFSVKSRLPWLQINLATAFLASAVVSLFDATIAQFTALAVLMPVVAGQSGNTGAQALAVVSRGLALREIRSAHVWRVLRKEGLAAMANGVAVAIVTCIGVYIWSGNVGLTAVIGVSMVISMLLAALAGGAIPIVLTALGRDPATASSIVLTTVTDVCGFFSFLGLATLLRGWLAAG